MSFTYDYPKADNTIDIIILRPGLRGDEVLLIERGGDDPIEFKGMLAIPGGYIHMNETLEQSAVRELQEETHIQGVGVTQFRTYGDPGRDPRGRVISTVFYAYVSPRIQVKADDDAKSFQWVSMASLPKLAFDHNQILEDFKKFIAK